MFLAQVAEKNWHGYLSQRLLANVQKRLIDTALRIPVHPIAFLTITINGLKNHLTRPLNPSSTLVPTPRHIWFRLLKSRNKNPLSPLKARLTRKLVPRARASSRLNKVDGRDVHLTYRMDRNTLAYRLTRRSTLTPPLDHCRTTLLKHLKIHEFPLNTE